MTTTKTRGKSSTLKNVDWKLALEDAERELLRTENHAEKLRSAIPVLRERAKECVQS
jgi:hypothetical protein